MTAITILDSYGNESRVSASNPIPISSSSGGSGATTFPVSTALESSHVLKSSAGSLYGCYVTTGTTAGYLMLFDATSAPADGAVTPKDCIPAPANAMTYLDYSTGAQPFTTGIVAVFSTTGPLTKTASATAFFKGAVA